MPLSPAETQQVTQALLESDPKTWRIYQVNDTTDPQNHRWIKLRKPIDIGEAELDFDFKSNDGFRTYNLQIDYRRYQKLERQSAVYHNNEILREFCEIPKGDIMNIAKRFLAENPFAAFNIFKARIATARRNSLIQGL